jgi:hypothetical protein
MEMFENSEETSSNQMEEPEIIQNIATSNQDFNIN